MYKAKRTQLAQIEAHVAETGWVAPLTQDYKDYFAYLQKAVQYFTL